MGELGSLLGPIPDDLLAAAQAVTHPALGTRVERAVAHPEVPSLIVTGADAKRRSLTAAAYVVVLDAAGVLVAAEARWVPEKMLPALDFDPVEGQPPAPPPTSWQH